jgi:hypothetical protein
VWGGKGQGKHVKRVKKLGPEQSLGKLETEDKSLPDWRDSLD